MIKAPFIGFLEERRAHCGNSEHGAIHVFFGCRNTDSFIYKQELENFKGENILVSSSCK